MEENMEKMDLKNIDKANWKTYRFDQIAKKISDTVDPGTTDLDIYIGLEHLDSDSIHIKRRGTPAEVSGGKLKFYPGDIIFGKRRAYQRKAAIVDFEGICSAHAFVLRAIPEVMDPKLFPFFLHSDLFMHCAVDISVGGLSPTINWGQLKEQEFLLPPKDQQAQLAKLLWAMDEVIEREVTMNNSIKSFLDVQIEKEIHGVSIFGKTINQVLKEAEQNFKLIELSEIGGLIKGKGIPKSDVLETGIPCVRYGELYTLHNRIIRKYGSYISEESKATSLHLKKHDVLFAGSGETITEIGKSAAFIDDLEAYAGSDILIFRPYDMDGTYLGYLMNSQLVRQQLNKYGTGATVMHIYNSDLAKIKVPNISREKQVAIGAKLELLSRSLFDVSSNITSSKALQKSLINQIF